MHFGAAAGLGVEAERRSQAGREISSKHVKRRWIHYVQSIHVISGEDGTRNFKQHTNQFADFCVKSMNGLLIGFSATVLSAGIVLQISTPSILHNPLFVTLFTMNSLCTAAVLGGSSFTG